MRNRWGGEFDPRQRMRRAAAGRGTFEIRATASGREFGCCPAKGTAACLRRRRLPSKAEALEGDDEKCQQNRSTREGNQGISDFSSFSRHRSSPGSHRGENARPVNRKDGRSAVLSGVSHLNYGRRPDTSTFGLQGCRKPVRQAPATIRRIFGLRRDKARQVQGVSDQKAVYACRADNHVDIHPYGTAKEANIFFRKGLTSENEYEQMNTYSDFME